MPFGKKDNQTEVETFNKVFKAIRDSAARILEFKVVFDRADMTLNEFELIKGVHKCIDNSDFCLADITGENPNVFYEMGYARAVGKEVIIISQPPKEGNSYPIDVRNMIVTEYSVESDEDYDVLSQKVAFLVERAVEISQSRTYSIKDAYGIECFQNRKTADLFNAFRNAKERIDILQTNLATIEKNYLESLTYALDHNEDLKLRVLTLDPDSYFTKMRADQLGLATVRFRNELHKSIGSVIKCLSGFEEKFSLRIYDDFPTQITFIIDDFVYTCTVAKNVRSRELCTFKLQKFAAGVERSFLFHFESIWSNARVYLPI